MNNLMQVITQLQRQKINYALGGSGMLLSLGLTESVNDWDIMTDAPKAQLLNALYGLKIEETTGPEHPFGTEYKLVVYEHEQDRQVDILGNLAIFSDNHLCKMPTIPTTSWHGVQVSAPEIWYVAYALMNRTSKAELLLDYLKHNPVNTEIIHLLKKELLSEDILRGLNSILYS